MIVISLASNVKEEAFLRKDESSDGPSGHSIETTLSSYIESSESARGRGEYFGSGVTDIEDTIGNQTHTRLFNFSIISPPEKRPNYEPERDSYPS